MRSTSRGCASADRPMHGSWKRRPGGISPARGAAAAPGEWHHTATTRLNHCCPLDQRVWNGVKFDLSGCFWTCMIFHRRWPIGAPKKKRRVLRLDEIKKLYDLMIDMVGQGKFASWKNHREEFAKLLTGGDTAAATGRRWEERQKAAHHAWTGE